VRLSPRGTSATNWPTVPAPEDTRWVWTIWWNENWQGKQKYSEETCPSVTLSTTNLTWPDLGSNPGRRGGKPATNRLSYVTVIALYITQYKKRNEVDVSVVDTIDKLNSHVRFLTSASWFTESGLHSSLRSRKAAAHHKIFGLFTER
jgi:hypothetical protein